MTIDLDKSYPRRAAVKMKKKTENIRFLKGKALSSSSNTLPRQVTLFHKTLIWIKGQRSKNQFILSIKDPLSLKAPQAQLKTN